LRVESPPSVHKALAARSMRHFGLAGPASKPAASGEVLLAAVVHQHQHQHQRPSKQNKRSQETKRRKSKEFKTNETTHKDKMSNCEPARRLRQEQSSCTDRLGAKKLLAFRRRDGQAAGQRRSAGEQVEAARGVEYQFGRMNYERKLNLRPAEGANQGESSQRATKQRGDGREQVIEFKFDLIVEEREAADCLCLAAELGRAGRPPACGLGGQFVELDRSVDELVESFVSDSSDVCLLTAGKRRLEPGCASGAACCLAGRAEGRAGEFGGASLRSEVAGGDEFRCLRKLIGRTLASSFALLNSKTALGAATERANLEASKEIQILPAEKQSDSPSSQVNHSIELSGSLMLSAGQPAQPAPTQLANSLEIVDLLAPNKHSGDPNSLKAVDCVSLELALAALDGMMDRVAEMDTFDGRANGRSKLLMVCMKLKQKINGATFSNRMCLINFDPNFLELFQILESIFSGQALAHLKRRKCQLECLQAGASFAHSEEIDVDFVEEKHHQVASERKLMEAEWILYKQLSSALLRTLVIVHVHKLSLCPKSIDRSGEQEEEEEGDSSEDQEELHLAGGDLLELERILMEENLLLLQFARSIQRASALRLKRRKRHLRSHLVSSNVSIKSNISAAATQTPESPFRQQMGGQHSLKRQGQFGSTGGCCGGGSGRGGGARGRKGSMDVSLALARHERRNLGQLPGGGRIERDSRQCWDCGAESSSMSTSSGSQGRGQVGSARGSKLRYGRTENNNLSSQTNLTDSDSATSANLNSRRSSSSASASSSYSSPLTSNKPLQVQSPANGSSGSNANCPLRSKQRGRDVELRGISKQPSGRQLSRLGQTGAAFERPELGLSVSPTRLPSATSSKATSLGRASRVSSLTRMASTSQCESSCVIPIDCEPNLALERRQVDGEAAHHLHALVSGERKLERERRGLSADCETDNVSDSSSIIAEPPKQLKLEEFLSQLSSIIGPMTLAGKRKASPPPPSKQVPDSVSRQRVARTGEALEEEEAGVGLESAPVSQYAAAGKAVADGCRLAAMEASNAIDGNNNQDIDSPPKLNADDDDEDCKSHSSILEHLSSLALESNIKLNNRNQFQRQQQQLKHDESQAFRLQPGKEHQNRGQVEQTGHLHRLLSAGICPRDEQTKLRPLLHESPSLVEHQLRELALGAYFSREQQTISSDPSYEALSVSIDSSCSSSNSSSTTETGAAISKTNLVVEEASLSAFTPAKFGPKSHIGCRQDVEI